MSMVAKRRQRNKAGKADELFTAKPPRRSRRRWWVLGFGLLALSVLWLLPAIIANTPLLRWILSRATADLQGVVEVESASLGWFSPIEVGRIEVRDAQGQPVLQAAALRGERSLVSILWDSSRVGKFRIERPKLNVVLRRDGSNVEDLIAEYLKPSEEPSAGVDMALEIVDGSVTVTDQTSRRTWQIEKLQLNLETSADASKPIKLETSADIVDPQRPGRLTASLKLVAPAAAEPASPGSGELNVETVALPLAMADALLARFAPQTHLGGRLSSKMHVQWGDETSVEADLETEGLNLTAPALGSDRVQLQHLHATCQISRHKDRIEIKQALLECDLGNLSAGGTLQLGQSWLEQLPASALKQQCKLDGRVDLARLARMLPKTLHIREGTEITSGQVQLALRSQPAQQGENSDMMIWQGRIETSDVKAVHQGREYAWQQPILITLAAHHSAKGPVVESLKCESDFLKVHMAGTLDELAASATFDLKQLADQLGQFVELDGIALAGKGWAHLNWKTSQRQFETDAELQIRNFQLALGEAQPWVEESLLLLASAAGQTDLGADTQLQTGSLQIQTATERITVRLTQPVLDFRGGGTWPVKLEVQGPLQQWPARLATWFALEDFHLAGDCHLAAEAVAAADAVTISQATLTVDQLQLKTPQVNVREPNVRLDLAAAWDQRKRRLQIASADLTSSGLSVKAENVVVALPEGAAPEMSGLVNYRGNIEHLLAWFADSEALNGWRTSGEFSGTAQVAQTDGVIDALVEAELTDLTVTGGSGERFHEPRVQLAAKGAYEHRTATLRLEQLSLTSAALGASTAGEVVQADQKTNVQLDGQVRYDLKKLTGLLRPYIGSEIDMAGAGASPISYQGPLSPSEARAAAGLSWQWANVYGVPIGPGELQVTLEDGLLKTDPLELAVSHGRVHLAPQVRLSPEPMELTLPPGPLASQVQITPGMCDKFLKYVAPVLAEVTIARGAFSIELDGCRIPLDDPAKGELAGRFTIHSVEIGPGSLVRELAVLLGSASPARLRRESVVQFRMVDGRVYHQGLELIFPDLTVRTYGSVGLDQTVAIVAEMSVPPKWLGNNPVSAALRDTVIRLPIGGTLSRPSLDKREIQRLSSQFIRDAARGALESEVGRQLERLFGQ